MVAFGPVFLICGFRANWPCSTVTASAAERTPIPVWLWLGPKPSRLRSLHATASTRLQRFRLIRWPMSTTRAWWQI
ncbi:hypothetical protein D3C75_979340 [compost metagenome]